MDFQRRWSRLNSKVYQSLEWHANKANECFKEWNPHVQPVDCIDALTLLVLKRRTHGISHPFRRDRTAPTRTNGNRLIICFRLRSPRTIHPASLCVTLSIALAMTMPFSIAQAAEEKHLSPMCEKFEDIDAIEIELAESVDELWNNPTDWGKWKCGSGKVECRIRIKQLRRAMKKVILHHQQRAEEMSGLDSACDTDFVTLHKMMASLYQKELDALEEKVKR